MATVPNAPSAVKRICDTDCILLEHFAAFAKHVQTVFNEGSAINLHVRMQEGSSVVTCSLLRRTIEFRYFTCISAEMKPAGVVACYASGFESYDNLQFVSLFEFDDQGIVIGGQPLNLDIPESITLAPVAAVLVSRMLVATLMKRPGTHDAPAR